MRKFDAEINAAIAGKLYKFLSNYSRICLDLLSTSPPYGSVEPKATDNARRLYKSCINENSIEIDSWKVIISFINEELRGWPSLPDSTWNASMFDLSYILLKLSQYNMFPFYYVSTILDYNSTDILRYRIRVCM